MFENLRRGRQARNFTTNVPKILDVKSSSEQIFSENRRVSLGAPDCPFKTLLSAFLRPYIDLTSAPYKGLLIS